MSAWYALLGVSAPKQQLLQLKFAGDIINLIKLSEMKQHKSFAHLDITAPIWGWSLTRDIIVLLVIIVQLVVFLLLKRNVQKVLILIVMKFLMPRNA